MTKRRIRKLAATISAFCLCTVFQASADDRFVGVSAVITNFALEKSVTAFGPDTILIKRGEKYDESKDPALRKGTENTEQPQGSFFAVPALVLGLVGLVLFLNRDKNNP